jgi:hypothetical protein
MAAFANEIGNYPMLFSLLQISNREPCRFGPPESAPEQGGDHGVIALTAQAGNIEYRE